MFYCYVKVCKGVYLIICHKVIEETARSCARHEIQGSLDPNPGLKPWPSSEKAAFDLGFTPNYNKPQWRDARAYWGSKL